MTPGARAATQTGGSTRRPRRRPGELFALELPFGEGRPRPARSPAAWLLALEREPKMPTPDTRRLAEHYARRAVRQGERWVVLLGDHTMRRAFRRLHDVDLAAVACSPACSLLSPREAEALIADGVAPVELQPLYDPAVDCSTLGVVRMREALERLVELGLAAVRIEAGRMSGVISIPNTWS